MTKKYSIDYVGATQLIRVRHYLPTRITPAEVARQATTLALTLAPLPADAQPVLDHNRHGIHLYLSLPYNPALLIILQRADYTESK